MRTIEKPGAAQWLRHLLPAAAIVLVTFIAYVPAMRGGWVWDDDAYVTQNPTLTTAAGLKQIWLEPRATPQYYPLVHSTFWIERHLWGLKPLGYHAVNVLLHVVNALLLWTILRRLNVPGAWFAACVFAVHPVHVESVAWVTERKNVLSAMFYLCALLAYLPYCLSVNEGDGHRQPWRWSRYLLVLALFLCALLSKTVACTFPAAVLLMVWWKRDGRIEWRRDVAPLLPMFAMGLAFGLTTAWLEKVHVGAEGKEWALAPIDRMHLAGRAAWFYFAKLLWPARLTFIYPRWNLDPGPWWQHAFPALTVGLLAGVWFLRHRIGRGPAVAVMLFGGTLLPALGFVDVYPFRYSFVADHFQYLASASVIAALAAAVALMIQRANVPRFAAVATCASILVTLAALTWQQGRAYRNAQTLWEDTLAKNPDCWMAHNNLAVCLLEQGQTDAAIAHAQASLRLKGDHAEAHNALGLILARGGKPDEAIEHYAQAVELKPQLASAQVNWGVLLARRGEVHAAEAHFAQAARLRPRSTDALCNWATALSAQGRQNDAIPLLKRLLEIDPMHAQGRLQLSESLLATGDSGGAFACLEEGIRLRPNWPEAQSRLGVMLASAADAGQRDVGRGIELSESACAATGRHEPAMLANLATVYAAAGRVTDARRTAREAATVATAAGRFDLAREIDQWGASLPTRDTAVGSIAE